MLYYSGKTNDKEKLLKGYSRENNIYGNPYIIINRFLSKKTYRSEGNSTIYLDAQICFLNQ